MRPAQTIQLARGRRYSRSAVTAMPGKIGPKVGTDIRVCVALLLDGIVHAVARAPYLSPAAPS